MDGCGSLCSLLRHLRHVADRSHLCGNAQMQFIFNSRKEAHADHNKKLLDMVRPSDTAAFIKDLNTTHYW